MSIVQGTHVSLLDLSRTVTSVDLKLDLVQERLAINSADQADRPGDETDGDDPKTAGHRLNENVYSSHIRKPRMANSDITLAAVAPVGTSIAGSNPSFLFVDDTSKLFNSRTGMLRKLVVNGNGTTFSDVSGAGPRIPGSVETDAVITVSDDSVRARAVLIHRRFAQTLSSQAFVGLGTLADITVSQTAPTVEVRGLETRIRVGPGVAAFNGVAVAQLAGIQMFADSYLQRAYGVRNVFLASGNCTVTTTASGFSDLGPVGAGTLTAPEYASFHCQITPPPGSTLGAVTGLRVNSSNFGAVGTTIQSNVGIEITERTSGTTRNYGIWFSDAGSTVGSGIAWGSTGDVVIYRSAAGVLRADANIRARRTMCLSTPTIAAGAGAGTTPVISVAGTDEGFRVTLKEGTPSATGVICTATFGGTSTGNAPVGLWSPGNAATAALTGTSLPYVTTTATTLVLNSGSAALTAGIDYVFNFCCTFY